MGLSNESIEIKTVSTRLNINKRNSTDKIIALAGNPNVGKSTVFNALTGLKQHTGNWPGKTVSNAQGYCTFKGQGYVMVDLPGCYSLISHSAEEEAARDFISDDTPDAVIVVCDASCIERNLNLVLQTLELTSNVVVCVNLMDEAKKKGIEIDISTLSELLGVPVVGTSARSKEGLDLLMEAVNSLPNGISEPFKVAYPKDCDDDTIAQTLVKSAESISQSAVIYTNKAYDKKDRVLDKFLTSKLTGFPTMFLVLIAIFWITIVGANYPSELIAGFLFWIEDRLLDFFTLINAPEFVSGILVLGIYRVLAWVVSVIVHPQKNHTAPKSRILGACPPL